MPWQIFNFVVFLVVLFFALRRPVREFWASRTHQIRFEIDEAARLKGESQERHDVIQGRLARIDREMKDLVQSLEKDGELEKKRIAEEARRFVVRLQGDSERIAAQEVRKAQEILKGQAVQLSLELAERLIRENLKGSDQTRMVEKYLTGLEGGTA